MKTMIALAVSGVLAMAGAARAETVSIPDSAKKQIEAVNAAWVPALEASDVERAAAGFADDCVFISADGSAMAGRAAFEDRMRKRFAGGLKITAGWVKQTDEKLVDGKIVEWGHSALSSVDAQGHKHETTGLYVAVWQEGKSGEWKIVRNLSF